MSETSPLRVLSIAHPAVKRHIGRLRYHPFRHMADIEAHLLVPARWHEHGRSYVADPADDPGIMVRVQPIFLPHLPVIGWYAHFYKGLPRLIKTLKPDVIHLWEEPWSAVAMQVACLKGGAAMVLEVDQNLVKRLPPPFEFFRRYVLQRSALILARSVEATNVVRTFGFAGPVRPIGYGVDQEVFSPRGESASRFGQGLRIGFVGRLVEQKGLDDALTAIARTRSPVSLAIMGEGPYDPHLRRRVEQLGLQKRVSFHGWGGAKEAAEFFRSLDVSILLSRSSLAAREQFGRTIIESQSCGIPVIGASSGAVPDVIGEGGWVVPERDPYALAQLLDRLSAAPEEVLAKSKLGRANVASRFTYEKIATTLATAWREAAQLRTATIKRTRQGSEIGLFR